MDNKAKESWEDVKATALAIELDVLKNADGNVSAGVRARRGLRMLRQKITDLGKMLRETDSERKVSRKASRTSKTSEWCRALIAARTIVNESVEMHSHLLFIVRLRKEFRMVGKKRVLVDIVEHSGPDGKKTLILDSAENTNELLQQEHQPDELCSKQDKSVKPVWFSE
jgi:hypothetical protein